MKNRQKSSQSLQKIHLFHDIAKVSGDDERMVYGYAIRFDEDLPDAQGEIITKAAVESALDDYFRRGNPEAPKTTGPLREMHTPSVAGSVLKAEIDDQGLYISAHVTDTEAWNKVKAGDYVGFSVGGFARERRGNKITKMVMVEISLADRSVHPKTRIDLWKADVDLAAAEAIPAKSLDPRDMDIQKNLGTYAISRLSDIIGSLNAFKEFYIEEERLEGDTSDVPRMLLRSIAGLGRILRTIVGEEMKELVEDRGEPDYPYGEEIAMAEGAGALTEDRVAQIVAQALAADRQQQDSIRKSAEAEALAKQKDEQIAALVASNTKLAADFEELKKSVTAGAVVAPPGTPAGEVEPAKAGTGAPGTVITKAQDAGAVGGDEVVGGIADPEKASVLDLMKSAHKVGFVQTAQGAVPFIRQ